MTDESDKQDETENEFKIPICYNKKVQKLNEHIIEELELVKSNSKEEMPIYENVFQPSNQPSLPIINQIAKYYTTDTKYLKQTQQLTKDILSEQLNTIHNKYAFDDFQINEVVSLWQEIKGETGFCEKYLYIDWSFAKMLNNNPHFLQLMSLYNIVSPILSLCLPIFVLIIPFFVIKLRGIELSIKQYIDILKTLISDHAIFKIFTKFHEIDNGQKIYLLMTSAFYLFSIYQNILTCIRFYSNMQKIHTYLFKFKKYISYTLDIMKYYSEKAFKHTKYALFLKNFNEQRDILVHLQFQLSKITPFTFTSYKKMAEIGHIMHCFYQLYDNPTFNKAMLYSFGFNGYFSILCKTATNIHENKLTKTTFVLKKKPMFKQMYYPKFIHNEPTHIIKNDCDLNKNIIITGPNASGKTTTLKTALINILLSQQIGYGCFEQLKLTPYDNIHCYLNIPDTSGRDSLFQAEARRCKEIINCIDEEMNKTHFCIFDELYSGTNPEEAVISGNAFMNYIVKHKNVTCMLTTHYVTLCEQLSKNKNIRNCHMKTTKEKDNFEYTYKLTKGISNIKGGLKVLHDMNYPKEMLRGLSRDPLLGNICGG
jgi:hypothetical protein